MLRASSKAAGNEVNLRGILSGTEGAVGVDHEELLLGFADALINEDRQTLDAARAALLEVLGSTALVDAAAVAGNFQRMNRIADACGIALGRLASMTGDIRTILNIEHFRSAANADGVHQA